MDQFNRRISISTSTRPTTISKIPLFELPGRKRKRLFTARSQKTDEEVTYKDPITRFIDTILQKDAKPLIVEPQFEGDKLRGLSLEQMKAKLIEGVSSTNWFTNGKVDYRLFSSKYFRFKDPSVEVFGIEEYALGVSRLFDPSTVMDIVETRITGEREIEMKWRLEAVLRLPFKPKIKPYYVTTYFRTDDEGLIYEQEEFFSIPEWELLLSIFFPNFGTPPAPPVS